MTELEWLKQQSGYTDEELKAFESIMGSAKFVAMLSKIQTAVTTASADKQAAEQARLDLENRYQNEMIPELRKTAKDAIQAQGEAARYKAELAKAREYGVVLDEPEKTVVDPPRAPGSPDPNAMTRDDFGRFEQRQANAVVAVQDLSAKHFKLFGEPLGDVQALVDETNRQRTLGNKAFTLEQAWEAKHNVTAKRDELAKAAHQKEVDTAVEARMKIEREKNGANPGLRSGRESRFSTYKPSDASGGKEPWQAPHSKNQANRAWRQKAVAVVSAANAA